MERIKFYQEIFLKAARGPVFGQLEDIANGLEDIDEFVIDGGNVKPADQVKKENLDRKPIMTGAREPVF